MSQGQPFGGDGIEGDDETRQRVQQFARDASAQMEQARMFLEDVNERVTAFVREKPGTALLGAVAIGWVLGKIASKASR